VELNHKIVQLFGLLQLIEQVLDSVGYSSEISEMTYSTTKLLASSSLFSVKLKGSSALYSDWIAEPLDW
jgi:hypothetical protein